MEKNIGSFLPGNTGHKSDSGWGCMLRTG